MAQNMRCTTSPNGLLQKGETGSSSSSPLYYDYPDTTLSLRERGLLYNWYGAMDTTANISYTYRRGICPEGWHVPSDAEWDTLTRYVFSKNEYKCGDGCGEWQAQSNVSCIAKALADTTGWDSSDDPCTPGNIPSANNATGFSAVPAGRYFYGNFNSFGSWAVFCSATQYDNTYAWYRFLNGYTRVNRDYDNKGFGFSVRCLKD